MSPRLTWFLLALGLCCGCSDKEDSSPCAVEERRQATAIALFDGKSLTGWDGDPAVWQVVDGQIVGNSGRRQVGDNTFLIRTDRTFGNFVLSADVLLVDDAGNSGIQFRSTIQDPVSRVVTGYQADVGHGLWGLLYEEGLGRGVLMYRSDACRAATVAGGWNHYEIEANGCRVVVKLNGALCSTFGEGDSSRPRSGYVALQYHAPGGFEVRFKNILIAELL
jgi:hypothetical protein